MLQTVQGTMLLYSDGQVRGSSDPGIVADGTRVASGGRERLDRDELDVDRHRAAAEDVAARQRWQVDSRFGLARVAWIWR